MNFLKKVDLNHKSLQEYSEFTPKLVKKSRKIAEKIKKTKVIHISATEVGGGVAELLKSQVPLERNLDLDSSWYVLKAPQDFFEITKKIHNLLQGKPGSLTKQEKDLFNDWHQTKLKNSFSALIKKTKPDIIVIHDPQPIGLIDFIPEHIASVFRFHVDLSTPNLKTLNFLKPLIKKYQKIIFTHKDYRPQWLPKKNATIIMPAIDPFSPKNKSISSKKADKILSNYQIKTDLPLVSQVSRFDPWKDPLGVIESYQITKKRIPDLQLLLVGIQRAVDDPEAKKVSRQVFEKTKKDRDIHIFTKKADLKGFLNDDFVQAVYAASDVVMQKSTKEGFGLTVTEAMWKNKAVIGGNTKGIALQIKHKKNGYLVNSSEEAARYLTKLLENKKLRETIGQKAHRSVKDNFLLSRYILDHLKLYRKIT